MPDSLLRRAVVCTLLALLALIAVTIGYMATGPHGLTREQDEVLASLRSGDVRYVHQLPHPPADIKNASEVRNPLRGAESYLYYPMPTPPKRLVIVVDEEFHLMTRYVSESD